MLAADVAWAVPYQVHGGAGVTAGSDSNPLVVTSNGKASSVVAALAWGQVDIAFGPFTRVYLAGGGHHTRLADANLALSTGWADARVLRRVEVVDLDARVGLSGTDVAPVVTDDSRGTPSPLVETLDSTGDSWTSSGSLSAASRPARVSGGMVISAARTVFPGRFPTGSEESERLSNAGALGFAQLRAGPVLAGVGLRTARQWSLRPEQDGPGREAHAWIATALHPDVWLRARGEVRRYEFRSLREKWFVGAAGVGLGHARRILRLDVSMTWSVLARQGRPDAERVAVLATLLLQRPAGRGR